jgi:hypothetical protein
MSETVESLILDLLEWVGPSPRQYDEVIDAWRTSCPRLPVWEEANERGFLTAHFEAGCGRFVSVTEAGQEYLRLFRRLPTEATSP